MAAGVWVRAGVVWEAAEREAVQATVVVATVTDAAAPVTQACPGRAEGAVDRVVCPGEPDLKAVDVADLQETVVGLG